MTFYSAQDFEQYYVTNVTRFEQIRDEALVEVCQTRVPIGDVPSEPINSTAAKMELCRLSPTHRKIRAIISESHR